MTFLAGVLGCQGIGARGHSLPGGSSSISHPLTSEEVVAEDEEEGYVHTYPCPSTVAVQTVVKRRTSAPINFEKYTFFF